ncbi:MAG TPA: dephospho-CoA kinase [Vicinamibacterales bacterium]
MLRVALTGGIATGKSHVLNEFRKRGVPCLDADALAHGVMTAGTEATAQIAERFGADVLDSSGAVDRHKLGAIVFADSAARRALEEIVHPAVYRAIAAGMRAFELLERSPLAIVDIPLLYETGHSTDFDRVIATVCPRALQIARLKERGLSDTEAEQRLAAQMSADEKALRADHIIQTDGTIESTNAQVDQILAILKS